MSAKLFPNHTLSYQTASNRKRLHVFPDAEVDVKNKLMSLWEKYEVELTTLSQKIAQKYLEITAAGFGAAFGDSEGELLYILIRETKPDLVYEISPNSGYSTNYLLAALTENGYGRLESFELIESFNGKPTLNVIRENLIDDLDFTLWNLNIGDAMSIVPERLKKERPSLTLIDSCHEDFFARFYIDEVLPKLVGYIFIQDIAHFDPRPEWATEAYYLLTFMEQTESKFILIGSYDDDIAPFREKLMPRRPIRSNSILFSATEANPKPDLDHRYLSVWKNGQPDNRNPGLIELLAIRDRRIKPNRQICDYLSDHFSEMDLFSQVMTVGVLATMDYPETKNKLLHIQEYSMHGSQLPLELARVAISLKMNDTARKWLCRGRLAACDTSLATGYREALSIAALYRKIGDREASLGTFHDALNHIQAREKGVHDKASREVIRFCLEHPRFFFALEDFKISIAQVVPVAIVVIQEFIIRISAAVLRRMGVGNKRT